MSTPFFATAHVEVIARKFHETYEALAPDYGYRTREASAKPWEDVPEQNKRLMSATVIWLLSEGVISVGTAAADEARLAAMTPLEQRLTDEARSV